MNDLAVDTSKSDEKTGKALAYANALTITSPEDYKQADSFCKGLFNLRKEIKADFEPSILKAKAAKKAASEALSALEAQEESHTKPVQDAERVIKTKLFAWDQEQQALRRKEQDRLRAEALKRAEDDKLRKAEALQSQGNAAAAIAELDKPVKIAPIVAPPVSTERETVISEYWSYEVATPTEVKREFCKPDPGVIQRTMNAMKAQGKTIQEVEAAIGGIRIEVKVK